MPLETSAVTRLPTSIWRLVMVPEKGAMTLSKPVSFSSRATAACCAWTLTWATWSPAAWDW